MIAEEIYLIRHNHNVSISQALRICIGFALLQAEDLLEIGDLLVVHYLKAIGKRISV